MLISNSDNPGELANSSKVTKEQTHPSENGVSSGTSGWLQSFAKRLIPNGLPVSSKLAISFGIMITIGMSLLGAVIVHNQTKLLNKKIHTYGRTIVNQMALAAKEP